MDIEAIEQRDGEYLLNKDPKAVKQLREYFEKGCLCIRDGKVSPSTGTDWKATQHYWHNCNCSRHPESSIRGE